MDARQTFRGLNRTESDAAVALGAFLIGTLVLLSTAVLALHFLSGLPPIMVAGIVFAILVFAIVCGAEFMKTDLSARHHGPPQLQFRNPVRRPGKRGRRRQPPSP